MDWNKPKHAGGAGLSKHFETEDPNVIHGTTGFCLSYWILILLLKSLFSLCPYVSFGVTLYFESLCIGNTYFKKEGD